MGNWGRWIWRNAGSQPPPSGVSGNLLRWIWRMAGGITPPIESLVGSYGTVYGVAQSGAVGGVRAFGEIQERSSYGTIRST